MRKKNMLAGLLRAIGWVTKDEREGMQIDYEHSWPIGGIRDKSVFLAHMIVLVPNGSVWSIEGIDDQILKQLKPYETTDDVKVMRATVWPRQTCIKVLLDDRSKKRIKEMLPHWDLDLNLTHQHIYYGKVFLLTSFDNLEDVCTRLSHKLDRDALDRLVQQGVFSFDEDDSNKVCTIR